MSDRIRVTLLSGFLGAGKTTLLNQILGQSHGLRIAVVENEFGRLNVDRVLVEGVVDELFELRDGCLCCSVYEDLIAALTCLMDRADRIDHLVIESTGLADPGPVIAGLSAPGIRDHFELAGVVTVVDAANVERDLVETEVCQRQIALADVLVLNKIDRVPRDQRRALELRLQQLNPLAICHVTVHARVDVAHVLARYRMDLPGQLTDTTHHHDTSIGAVSLELEGDIDIEAIDAWLGSVVRIHDVLRMKGILAVPNDPRRFVFQGVRRWVDVHPHTPWQSERRLNQLVFIGRDLDPSTLRAGLASCAFATHHAAASPSPCTEPSS